MSARECAYGTAESRVRTASRESDCDPPTFARVNLDRVLIFLERGAPSPEGCSVYFVTNEPLGDGVASLHTKRTIAYIQELKKKHGIDYDSHASYRFTEG